MKQHGNTKHGMSMIGKRDYSHRHPVYLAWVNMRQRCNNVNKPDYKYYGGRGIKVCKRWDKFDNFLKDMGIPEAGMTLDRINAYNNYSPKNCRWATRKTQSNNRPGFVKKLEYNGMSLTIPEWAEELGNGFTRDIIYGRITKHGWSVERALTQPVRS